MRRTWAKCCDWGRPTSGKESWDHTVNLTVELRLETRQNSFESSVEGFCDLRGEEVVWERENRRMGTGTGTKKRRLSRLSWPKPAQWELAKMAARPNGARLGLNWSWLWLRL